MAGRHSKRRHTHARVQRGPRLMRITDARTRIEHLMTDASAVKHRHLGSYLTLCGAQVLAASLAEPSRGRCSQCAR